MTSPPERIEVTCPGCRHVYEAWHRPSINLSLGQRWTDEEIDDATTARCQHCGHRVTLDSLVVDEG